MASYVLHVATGLATGACAISAAILAVRSRQRPKVLFTLLGLVTAAVAGPPGGPETATLVRAEPMFSVHWLKRRGEPVRRCS